MSLDEEGNIAKYSEVKAIISELQSSCLSGMDRLIGRLGATNSYQLDKPTNTFTAN